MRNRLSPRFDPVEVVKVVVFKVLRVTSSKYARIKRKFTQKPIFNYLDYLGGVNLESSPNLCVNCFRHNMQEAA